ncbi:leucyl aminopeptidase family protein [Caenispirillum bisanense]|uniref:leucyl aminopeptidase family protein n=1 Tax=Caenispirillum bisanense TaxID=414052 RepID=UPI003CD089B6
MLVDPSSPAAAAAVPLTPISPARLEAWRAEQDEVTRRWLDTAAFKAEAGSVVLLPGSDGALARVIAGTGDGDEAWALAALPGSLPKGCYRLDPEPEAAATATALAFGWEMGGYAFSRYKSTPPAAGAALVWPAAADRTAVGRDVAAVTLVRDLINTPAADMGPEELEAAALALADAFGATLEVTVGEELERAGYPAVFAVGKGSSRPPRLIDLRWGDASHPKVTLVGKGVCFDSGGYDLKPSSGMKLMKKDMGGAANVLGLARMIMAAGLPVRLRVLVPAVENMVSGHAMRPLDVLRTRKGLTVEVGNTDAEGRLILCDALAEADTEQPELLIDCATLTGAARVAMGAEVVPFFTHDDALAADLVRHGTACGEPLWRLPLWKGYRKQLDSKVADLCNISDSPFGGAITAGLFLAEFVSPATRWVHIDMYGWNPTARPGRPVGGEAFALRALYALIADRFG